MRKLSNWLRQISTGWVALSGLVIFLLFTALILPGQAAQAEAYGSSASSPDSSFYYSAGQLYQFAETYGSHGRQAYIQARWTFDVAWPLVYAAFQTTSISWLTHQTYRRDSLLRALNLVPILGLSFDFLENASTSLVMARFPSQIPFMASLAGYFTAVKWIFVGGSFLALVALVVLAGWDQLHKRSR